jgi:hypothetical protein
MNEIMHYLEIFSTVSGMLSELNGYVLLSDTHHIDKVMHWDKKIHPAF